MTQIFQVLITLIIFFGGFLFWALNKLLFLDKKSNIFTLIDILISFVPLFGFAFCFGAFISNIFNYQKYGFSSKSNVQVRPLWICRILFNDVDWDEYDEIQRLKRKKEDLKRKQVEAEKMNTKKKKLIEGMNPAVYEPLLDQIK